MLVARTFNQAFRRLTRVLARPVKADRGRGGPVIQAYRGYGSRQKVFLMGRVFRQPRGGSFLPPTSPGRDLLDLGRRLLRRGLGDAVLTARFCGSKRQVTTDRDGYFQVQLQPVQPPAADRLWHTMELQLTEPAGSEGKARGRLFIPPAAVQFVVISDIDDTVVFTGVADRLRMLWRLFVQPQESRVAFPGVAAFYRALYGGEGESGRNPLLYVSRSPWSLYEVLEAFFQRHAIPVGPILFLREWGLPFFRRAEGHKLALIRSMLDMYERLPFVLIGDSGQQDPEIYTQVVKEYPGRVLAVYIRNISQEPRRIQAIEALARQVAEAGSSFLLAADTFAMAVHAAAQGLIGATALAEVLAERVEETGRADLKPMRTVGGDTSRQTAEAIDRGEVAEKLSEGTGGEGAPNVVVQAEQQQDDRPPE